MSVSLFVVRVLLITGNGLSLSVFNFKIFSHLEVFFVRENAKR